MTTIVYTEAFRVFTDTKSSTTDPTYLPASADKNIPWKLVHHRDMYINIFRVAIRWKWHTSSSVLYTYNKVLGVQITF